MEQQAQWWVGSKLHLIIPFWVSTIGKFVGVGTVPQKCFLKNPFKRQHNRLKSLCCLRFECTVLWMGGNLFFKCIRTGVAAVLGPIISPCISIWECTLVFTRDRHKVLHKTNSTQKRAKIRVVGIIETRKKSVGKEYPIFYARSCIK